MGMKKNNEIAEDTRFPVYQCLLPVSRQTVNHCTGLLARHLEKSGSKWRRLPAPRIVTLVLALLRHDQRVFDLAGGNAISETTLRRWRDELLRLLAAQAPRLPRVLRKIARRGGEAVLIDGTLIPTQRRSGASNRKNYSGKHRRHGLHFLALTDEKGRLLWISAARPGSTHDTTAARRDHIVQHLRDAGLGALADLGFVGVDNTPEADPDDPVVVNGFKATRARKLNPGQKQANQVLAAARAPVEHGFAALKCWQILTKLRIAATGATALLRALLILTNLESNR
ncbi:transposase family protein [Streptomyces sp. NPDC058297]|uniref:transposase family protein n=1 Tax=Streptomyces sp. NPDC058297 TaxID=3346433 RepID=UPI0036E1A80D